MVRLGTAYDINDLKKLWDESFDDSVNYIDFIFDKVSSPSDAMICEVNGEVASMLLMIPTRFIYRNEAVNTLYILGAATSKKFRDHGLMTDLIKQAEDRARNSGAGLSVLVPGEKYLFDFYKKRGYSADFRLRSVAIKTGMMDSAPAPDTTVLIDRVSPSDLHEVRAAALSELPHVSWSARQMPFVLDDSLIYGDHVAYYDGGLGRSYAFFSMDRRKMYIKECLGTTVEAQLAMLKGLFERQDPKSVRVNLPIHSKLFAHEGNIVPYGMAKTLNVNASFRDLDSYMNMMLD